MYSVPCWHSLHVHQDRTPLLCNVLCNCRYEDTKEELDEYEASSKELEAEMEVQLEQSEKKVKDLTSHNERLQTELEQLRVSYWHNNVDIRKVVLSWLEFIIHTASLCLSDDYIHYLLMSYVWTGGIIIGIMSDKLQASYVVSLHSGCLHVIYSTGITTTSYYYVSLLEEHISALIYT